MSLRITQSNSNDTSPETIRSLVNLINEVYASVEGDMWKPDNSGRTYDAEVEKFVKNGEIFIARIDDEIVGSVRIEHIDDQTLAFGMLVADPDRRSEGIGRELVATCENHARENGYTNMQLELLTPRHWENPSKEFLKEWYGRIGYIPTKSRPFEEISPHRMDEFATECDFTVWIKEL
ncbi:GNAT family N-acetyltransferase [Pseudemcibacter aquimaris]|uniref:GNAT family N-acetyltransferase n=1 Tax=Pseudemcibacter aquimaris TaxID=2857064 RepID=UPI00201331A7|nr:GNAT family N-acetyltransferase [Pseudemcibacter aquimaris]MCC3859617.1 GNAT family N-acetyltransferase [Pseudemcibacter aquimaris]WDU60012.1 GNAT family N-acetyltransferase [Pseudemcibacter aquimaris]